MNNTYEKKKIKATNASLKFNHFYLFYKTLFFFLFFLLSNNQFTRAYVCCIFLL